MYSKGWLLNNITDSAKHSILSLLKEKKVKIILLANFNVLPLSLVLQVSAVVSGTNS